MRGHYIFVLLAVLSFSAFANQNKPRLFLWACVPYLFESNKAQELLKSNAATRSEAVTLEFLRDRHFSTHFDALDPYDRWWCESRSETTEARFPPPQLLTRSDAKVLKTETQILQKYPSGQVFALDQAVALHRKKSDRAAEALAFAVQGSKNGCYEIKNLSEKSKQAFEILKKHYPQTKWAIQTKYWY